MSEGQGELLHPVHGAEREAYAELDAWLEGVSLGDPKLLALSDVAAASSIDARLGRPRDLLEDEKMVLYARRAQVEETERVRQDTVPGYAQAQLALRRILDESVVPYERKEMDSRTARGNPVTVPRLLATQLGRRREAIVLKPQAKG